MRARLLNEMDWDEVYEKAWVPVDDDDLEDPYPFDADSYIELEPPEVVNKPRYKFVDN